MKEILTKIPLEIYTLLEKLEGVSLTKQEIISYMDARGITAKAKDIEKSLEVVLNGNYGVTVTSEDGVERYSIQKTVLTHAEIKILLDAVNAAAFVSERKTNELAEKILKIVGAREANFQRKSITFKTAKHTNDGVFDAVELIDASIRQGKKCSFLYFDYDVEGARLYRKERARYVVNPVSLVFSEDNYYLLAYGDKYENLASYRVDRMDKVRSEDEAIKKVEWLKNFDVETYKKQAFSMFKGELTEVTLVCDKSAVDVVVDKFSEYVNMLKLDDETFRIKVNVQVSPTFFGWCATSGGKIKITAPEEVKEAYVKHLTKCL